MRDVGPVDIIVGARVRRVLLFRELVGRYHYTRARGRLRRHLRYLVFASRPARAVVGCLQFSSPAWRMAAWDHWVGWDEAVGARNLQRVVNNSRFLLVPWVAVKNLASAVLARGLARLAAELAAPRWWKPAATTGVRNASTVRRSAPVPAP